MRVETPAARRSDPATSHEAAEAVTRSGARHTQRQQVARALRENPGATTAELARIMDWDRYMVGRRMSECETAGEAIRGAKKRCTVSGRKAEMWWPKPKQGDLL